MRTLERLIVVALLPAIAWFLLPTWAAWPDWMPWFAIVAALLVLVHAALEGMHWQMGPAYLAVTVLLVAENISMHQPAYRVLTAVAAGLLLAGSVALSWALPMFRLPEPTGRYPVGTRMLYLRDLEHQETHGWAEPGDREVVVQLWYPAASAKGLKASYRRKRETSLRSSYQAVLAVQSIQDAPLAEGRFPVIVHNPGWHGWRQRGTFMTQELASHGFVVAGVSHPYNSSFVELSDGTLVHPNYDQDIGFSTRQYIALSDRFQLAEEELVVQTRDCRLLLDEMEKFNVMPGHPLEGHLLMDRVGGYGFSFGGAVSAELAREDSRVRSALGLDGVLHGESAQHGVEKPLMLIDSPWMVDPLSNNDDWLGRVIDESIPWGAVANEETQLMWKTIADIKASALSRTGGYRVILQGMGHPDFTDQIFMSPLKRLSQGGVVEPMRAAQILNAYVLAFFQETLMDIPSALLSPETDTFPEVKLQKWKAGNAAAS